MLERQQRDPCERRHRKDARFHKILTAIALRGAPAQLAFGNQRDDPRAQASAPYQASWYTEASFRAAFDRPTKPKVICG